MGFLQRDVSMRALWSDRQNCSHNVAAAPAQKLIHECFLPLTLFILPFLCALRAFSEGLSVREHRTQSQNEEPQREVGRREFCLFLWAARRRSRIRSRNRPKFFSPFFLAPKKSTPNPRQFRGQNPCQFRNSFSQWFLWVLDPGLRRCSWMPMLLCLPTKTCKLTLSVVGASSDTTQRASTH